MLHPERRGQAGKGQSHIPQVVAEDQKHDEHRNEGQRAEVPRAGREQLGRQARAFILAAQEAPQRGHGDSGLSLARTDDRAIAAIVANPRLKAFQERSSQPQKRVAYVFTGKAYEVRNQITGDGATSALIAACGVELSIPPNVVQQCRIALNWHYACCHLPPLPTVPATA